MLTASKALPTSVYRLAILGVRTMKFRVKLRRLLGAASALVVCVGLATAPVIAQDSVELQFRLERREVLYFAASTSVQSSVRFPHEANRAPGTCSECPV